MNNILWTAIFGGTHDGTVTNNFSMNFDNGTVALNVAGDTWENNQWHANVSGSYNGQNVYGEAAGTYDETNFTGIGVGGNGSEWQPQTAE